MLEESSRALLRSYAGLQTTALAGEYQDGLRWLADHAREPKLILWLGSNIGNLHRDEAADFLRKVRAVISPRDRFLVGIDLRKDKAVLEKAYDDSRGVTAQFNKNVLARINRELDGHFDLRTFEHRAVYEEEPGRIKMYLVSTQAQRVKIDRLDVEIPFSAGEAIHTENSYKYSLDEIETLAGRAALRIEGQWFDIRQLFCTMLFSALL